MLRRRLYAYAVAVAAGITAGDMATEQEAGLLALLFLAMLGIALAIMARMRCQLECPMCGEAEAQRRRIRRDALRLGAAVLLGCTALLLAQRTLQIPESDILEAEALTGRMTRLSIEEERVVFDLDAERIPGASTVRCTWYFPEEAEASAAEGLSETRATQEKTWRSLYGRRIRVSLALRVPEPSRNPGAFDYRRYLKGKGILYIAQAEEALACEQLGEERIPWLWRFRRVMAAEKEAFSTAMGAENTAVYAFLKGVTFGDRSALDEETETAFRENTTAHVLAVSGLHVGFLYALLRLLTRGRKGLFIAAALLAVLLLYGELTQWNASTLRAVILTAISLLAFYLRRPFDLLSGLSAAAVLMLLANPYALFDAGFVMSYLAVGGIAVLSDPMSRLFGRPLGFLFSIQLVMVPYTAYTFNSWNPLGMLINIPIVFLAGILVPLALGGFVLCLCLGGYPEMLQVAVSAMTELILELNAFLHADGLFSYSVRSGGAGASLLFYVLLFFLASEFCLVLLLRKERKRLLGILLLLTLLVLPPAAAYRNPFDGADVIFIDVGQGDAIHIRASGRDILIDGGGSAYRNVGEQTLKPYFLRNGTGKLDLCLFTHMHTDHAKGAEELARSYPVKRFLLPAIYRGNYSSDDEAISFIDFGASLRVGKALRIKVLWPLAEAGETETSADEENERNAVYLIEYRSCKILVTGDLLEEEELAMVEYYAGSDTLRCDVLKVAHHGSKYSSADAFLDAVDPAIAVIQVGKDNLYGHPSEETLQRLEERGVRVYRNDLQGAIGLDIGSDDIRVRTMLDADEEP